MGGGYDHPSKRNHPEKKNIPPQNKSHFAKTVNTGIYLNSQLKFKFLKVCFSYFVVSTQNESLPFNEMFFVVLEPVDRAG